MANEKKVSVNQINKLNIKKPPTKLDIDGVEIIVKHSLSLVEVIAFTRSVVEGIIDYDIDGIEYCFKDFIIAINMVSHYTNIRLPENLEKQYEFITNSRIVDKIKDVIDEVQYWHILESIDEQIEFEKDRALCQFKVETQRYIAKLQDEVGKVIAAFEKLTNLFEDIDPDIVTDIIPKLSELDNITEEGIVDATMNYQRANNAEI